MEAPKRTKAGPNVKPLMARSNSLGLNPRDLAVLLDEFDQREAGKKNPQRSYVRWPFRKVSIAMKLIHPGRSESAFQVACRNISREGVGILHNAYIHPGTKCAIGLPHPIRGIVWVEGTIVRCVHRGGMTHEGGVKFNEPINAKEFIDVDPLTDWFTIERVVPDQLTGTIVLLDDSEMDRRIARHYMRETQLRVREAKTPDEAIALCLEGADLVIVSYHLEGTTGADFVALMREKGVPTPVIVTTSDVSLPVRERLKQVRANASLAKPLTQETLLRAVAEFLTVQQGGESLSSTLSPDDPASNLVNEYVQSLRQNARKLEHAMKTANAESARTLALQIKGSAPTLGFPSIAKLAEDASIILSRTSSTVESGQVLRALITACDRARGRADE